MRKEEDEIAVAMRAGFTLIEILVAVAIVGILSTVAVMNLGGLSEGAKITAAKSTVDTIQNAVVTYNLNHQKNITDLKDLVKEDSEGESILSGGEDALVDPWGTDCRLEKKGRNYVIVSAGPDGQFNTEDDVRSDKKPKQASKE